MLQFLTRKLCYREDDSAMRAISGSNKPPCGDGHSKSSEMAACRQLGFDVTRNKAWILDIALLTGG